MERGAERLVGRDAEVEAISRWLREATPDRPALVVEGVPGIGKTAVVADALATALALPMRVLAARPAEPEADLAHAGLLDLIGRDAEDVLPGLPPPQRHALEVALLRRPAEAAPPDRLAVSVATAATLAALAEPDPVLVVIDDAQWLDPATSEVLRFVARRSRDGRVRILAARRAGMPSGSGFGGDLPSDRRIALGPLSLGAIHAIVYERTGLALDRPRLRRLHELSGGNAFYAIELARGISAGTFGLAEGDPLPPDLESLVGRRVADLPPETQALLATAAAASAPTVRLLSAVAPDEDVAALLAPAVEAGIIGRPTAVDGAIVFEHPLLAGATLATVSADERRGLHRALARSVSDPVERARHLAEGSIGPDEAVATILEGAALDAFRRGAPSVAADLSAAARQFSEPSDHAAIERRSLSEAEYRFEAGAPHEAASILDGLIESTTRGPARARLLGRRARIAHFADDVGGGVSLLKQALDEAGRDTALRGEIEEGLAWGLLLMRADLADAIRHASNAVRHATTDAARAEALAAKALSRFAVGLDATAPMREALELEPATLNLRVLRHPSFARAYQLTCIDDLDGARGLLEDLRARAEAHGDESAMATIFNHLASVETLAGRYPAAAAHASAAAELAHESGQRPARAAALGRLAIVATHAGDEVEARHLARQALELAADEGADHDPRLALARGGEAAMWALGVLSLATGDAGGAVRHLGPMADALLGAGIREPGELRFVLDEVEGHIALGEMDAARSRADLLEDLARETRRPGARVAAGVAAGQVTAAFDDPVAAIDRLGAAAEDARALPTPLVAGRALLALGRVERRAKRRAAARATLTEAVESFTSIGATRWVTVANAEIARIGGRVASTEELTPTESAVAELVATGMSNREVAAALFVTPKAVEANLARVFAKRGVRSRTELARLMASEATAGEGPKA
jgi:DNA-binding CsgD family transcriptional regulator